MNAPCTKAAPAAPTSGVPISDRRNSSRSWAASIRWTTGGAIGLLSDERLVISAATPLAVLQEVFGYPQFRAGQAAAVQDAAEGAIAQRAVVLDRDDFAQLLLDGAAAGAAARRLALRPQGLQ